MFKINKDPQRPEKHILLPDFHETIKAMFPKGRSVPFRGGDSAISCGHMSGRYKCLSPAASLRGASGQLQVQ